MYGLILDCSRSYECAQKLDQYVAKTFYLFELPKQFKGKDEFYFATLKWKKENRYDHDYWTASVLALNDADTDQKIFDRALRYMKRTKLDWEVHACDKWSCCVCDDEPFDYSGKPFFDFWLRNKIKSLK